MNTPTAISTGLLNIVPRTSDASDTAVTETIPAKLRRAGSEHLFSPPEPLCRHRRSDCGNFRCSRSGGSRLRSLHHFSDGRQRLRWPGGGGSGCDGCRSCRSHNGSRCCWGRRFCSPRLLRTNRSENVGRRTRFASGSCRCGGLGWWRSGNRSFRRAGAAGTGAGAGAAPAAAAFCARIFAIMSAVDGFFSSITN